ncbi:MAG: hypothetical protein ABIP90_00270 [Vicinamibacterales bacterium]
MKMRRDAVFPGRPVVPGEEHDPIIAKPLGVSFSGGGIRSATLNLGVIQGLADLGLLRYIDYLSTVSGGGYIGSWLHGVIRNNHDGDPAKASDYLSASLSSQPGRSGVNPITFLRKFSNYLAPRPGLFNADTWVIGLIWLRNTLLNQLILIPALSSVVLLAQLLVFLQQIPLEALTLGRWVALAPAAAVFAALGYAVIIAAKNLNVVVRQTFASSTARGEKTSDEEHWEHKSTWIPRLVFGAAIVLGCMNLRQASWPLRGFVAIGLFMIFAMFQVRGGFIRCYGERRRDSSLEEQEVRLTARQKWQIVGHIVWMTATAAAVSTGLLILIWNITGSVGDAAGSWAAWNRVAFAPPLVSLSLIAGVALHVGLMGPDYPDAAREWIARVASTIALFCAGWAAFFVLAVHLPKGFASLVANHLPVALTAIGGWLATTAAGVLAGQRSTSRADEPATGSGRWLGLLAGLAPTLFMIGYLMLLSFGAHAALTAVSPPQAPVPTAPEAPNRFTVDVRVPETAPGIEVDVRGPARKGWFETTLTSWKPFAANYYDVFKLSEGQSYNWDRPRSLLGFIVICLVVAGVASLRININEFSLHHFYKNRIVRCYLGASRTRKRKPNSLTGFDPADDFALSSLVPEGVRPYYGPYAIVNAALNVNAGSELATQERKAMSFVFTPDFCGFAPTMSEEDMYTVARHKGDGFEPYGYRPTQGYGYPSGPALGTTVAISGAAANPNSGYATSGPMAFLLTIFDARLGWWVGNPRWREESKWPGPAFALKYLLSELVGQTTARSKFVNLSDGGHFDNLGLYELVRRRCRYIIIGDSEQDGDLSFGALGGAIRKCRADFGVEIDINPNPIRLSGTGFSNTHCVVGTINYPEQDAEPRASIAGAPSEPSRRPNARGWLLYLKSSLTGDEPADVIEYRSRIKEFPHESTGDQFFSESQFESYRRLGLHIVRDAFDGVLPSEPRKEPSNDEEPAPVEPPASPGDLQHIFQALTRKWYAPPVLAGNDMSRLNDAYSELMRKLGAKAEMQALMTELLFDETSMMTPAMLDQESRAFLIEVIQLMENVHTEYRFEHAANRANPRNAGWITVCRRWAQRPVVIDVWNRVRKDYNPMFAQFMDLHLRSRTVDDVPVGL